MINVFFSDLFSVSIFGLIIFFWFVTLMIFFWFWFSWQKKNKTEKKEPVLINNIFASNVKFYFVRNKFTEVTFQPKPFFLRQKTISMHLFLNFLHPQEMRNLLTLLNNYKNNKKYIKRKFILELKIKQACQKYYFQNIGCFSKTIKTSKVYTSNYILFLVSNLDKLLK